MNYPNSYHFACKHLVAFGGHNGNTKDGRHFIACALRDMRKISREQAQFARKSMLFISGMFPVKSN